MLGNVTTSREPRRKLRQVANAKVFGRSQNRTYRWDRKSEAATRVRCAAQMADHDRGDGRRDDGVLDASIINVSLAHMQGSFSASIDEIVWVLTSGVENR